MSTNINSGDYFVERSLSYQKMASANDRSADNVRQNVDLKDTGQMKRDHEVNLREVVNMEIGRARNLSKVV